MRYAYGMNIVILGGNSSDNVAWVREVAGSVGTLFTDVYVHPYEHWQSNTSFIDFAGELNRLSTAASPLEPYVIFAKSVGVLLAAEGIATGKLQAHGCIFVGTPLELVARQHYALAEWLRTSKVPTVFIQHTDDPAGSYASLQQYMAEEDIDTAQLHELPGATHHYDELDQLTQIASRFSA